MDTATTTGTWRPARPGETPGQCEPELAAGSCDYCGEPECQHRAAHAVLNAGREETWWRRARTRSPLAGG